MSLRHLPYFFRKVQDYSGGTVPDYTGFPFKPCGTYISIFVFYFYITRSESRQDFFNNRLSPKIILVFAWIDFAQQGSERPPPVDRVAVIRIIISENIDV